MRWVTAAALVAASCGTVTPAATPASPARVAPKKPERQEPPPGPPDAPAPAPTPSDEDPAAAIGLVLDTFAKAVADRDAETIAALHVDSPDTIAVWPSVGEEIIGIEAIRTALRQELPTWESVTFVITDFRVQMLGPGLAYVWGHYDQDLKAHAQGTRRGVSRRVRGARFFAVMKREPEGWRMLIESGSIPVTAAMWETLADPPPYELRPRPR